MVRTSVVQLERFQDTLNPGYFLIRVAVLVLAVVILLAAVIGPMPTYLVCSPRPRQSGRQGGQDQ